MMQPTPNATNFSSVGEAVSFPPSDREPNRFPYSLTVLSAAE